MLAPHVERHMRRHLAPIPFGDDGREGARARRTTPVEPAKVSASAGNRADRGTTADGLPVHSFCTPLADPATLTVNEPVIPGSQDATVITPPNHGNGRLGFRCQTGAIRLRQRCRLKAPKPHKTQGNSVIFSDEVQSSGVA